MTPEEKAKAYDEALERAKKLIVTSVAYDKFTIEKIFPELSESEDEKIRKDVLAFIRREGQHIDKYKWHKWIAWLEKQNHDGKKWIYEDVYLREKEQLIQDGIDEVLENPQKYGLEKQEVPKFKIGQRIKQGNTIAEIKEISKDGYHCDIAFVPFTAEDNWELSLWDENDDKLLYECEKEIWKSAPTMLSLKHEEIERWLESLKQRLNK